MTPSRKHSSAAFWASMVVVVALVGYPLSLGPACWIASHKTHWSAPVLSRIYWPATWAMMQTEFTAMALQSYSKLVAAPGWSWDDDNGGWIWREAHY
jgi:hypothetical protein